MGLADGNVDKYSFLGEYAHIGPIEAMITVAKSMGIDSGVSVFLVEEFAPKGISSPHFKAVDGFFYGRNGNHLGAAMAMIATMKGTRASTGMSTSHILKGETVEKGGLLVQVDRYCVHIAFAGDCTEDQNLEIAQAGMKMLFPDWPKV